MNQRSKFTLSMVSAALAILIAVLIATHWTHSPDVERRPKRTRSVSSVKPSKSAPGFFVPPRAGARPVSAGVLRQAHSDLRLRSTYRNFRAALATGNRILQENLMAALKQHHTESVKIAEEELAKAVGVREQEINQKALEALRR